MTWPPHPPRPRRTAGARSTAVFTLLAIAAAAAVWVTVQAAHHTPRSGRGDLAPSGPGTPSASHSGTPPSPHTTPSTLTGLTGEQDITRPAPAPARTRTRAGTPDARTPRPVPPRPSRKPPRRPPQVQPRKPAQPQAPAWIRAECARRFDDGPRRSACVTQLQQTLSR
ncbi:hypothetical protein [Actinomadura rudentiformis]|uniref:Uncharacterized protein n=1 Tax=Actinomadura rudentiformis TaxID=359158 RepID=A0A6H9YWB2_9ACTN|nr:hypothetical protein [Actinomadura rudentiformis]KAB2349036.1 hypothetical protein F8566_14970 [Actinomadura rudentiformis]